MTARERFEAWAVSRDLSLRVGDGISAPDYRDSYTYYAYDAWQASRKQALAEALQGCQELLAVSGRQARDGDHFEIGREGGHMECITAIEALANPEGEQG